MKNILNGSSESRTGGLFVLRQMWYNHETTEPNNRKHTLVIYALFTCLCEVLAAMRVLNKVVDFRLLSNSN